MIIVLSYLFLFIHGGRRHNCSNNPTYRKYSARIVERMAQEFGADERVVAWQMDNEIYTYFAIKKYPKTTTPSTILYQPKALKSCFLM